MSLCSFHPARPSAGALRMPSVSLHIDLWGSFRSLSSCSVLSFLPAPPARPVQPSLSPFFKSCLQGSPLVNTCLLRTKEHYLPMEEVFLTNYIGEFKPFFSCGAWRLVPAGVAVIDQLGWDLPSSSDPYSKVDRYVIRQSVLAQSLALEYTMCTIRYP